MYAPAASLHDRAKALLNDVLADKNPDTRKQAVQALNDDVPVSFAASGHTDGPVPGVGEGVSSLQGTLSDPSVPGRATFQNEQPRR